MENVEAGGLVGVKTGLSLLAKIVIGVSIGVVTVGTVTGIVVWAVNKKEDGKATQSYISSDNMSTERTYSTTISWARTLVYKSTATSNATKSSLSPGNSTFQNSLPLGKISIAHDTFTPNITTTVDVLNRTTDGENMSSTYATRKSSESTTEFSGFNTTNDFTTAAETAPNIKSTKLSETTKPIVENVSDIYVTMNSSENLSQFTTLEETTHTALSTLSTDESSLNTTKTNVITSSTTNSDVTSTMHSEPDVSVKLTNVFVNNTYTSTTALSYSINRNATTVIKNKSTPLNALTSVTPTNPLPKDNMTTIPYSSTTPTMSLTTSAFSVTTGQSTSHKTQTTTGTRNVSVYSSTIDAKPGSTAISSTVAGTEASSTLKLNPTSASPATQLTTITQLTNQTPTRVFTSTFVKTEKQSTPHLSSSDANSDFSTTNGTTSINSTSSTLSNQRENTSFSVMFTTGTASTTGTDTDTNTPFTIPAINHSSPLYRSTTSPSTETSPPFTEVTSRLRSITTPRSTTSSVTQETDTTHNTIPSLSSRDSSDNVTTISSTTMSSRPTQSTRKASSETTEVTNLKTNTTNNSTSVISGTTNNGNNSSSSTDRTPTSSTSGIPSTRAFSAQPPPPERYERTIIFLRTGTDIKGQIFIRGGLSDNSGLSCGGALDINPCNLRILNYTEDFEPPDFDSDHYLDWGDENRIHGSPLVFTYTEDKDGNGLLIHPLNSYNQRLSTWDVTLDCTRTSDGWFEFQLDIPGQRKAKPCKRLPRHTTPPSYVSEYNFAHCGSTNYFDIQFNECVAVENIS